MTMLLLLVPRAASFVYFYCHKNFVKGNGKVHLMMEHFNKAIKSLKKILLYIPNF